MNEAQVGRTVVRREYIMLLRLGEDPNTKMEEDGTQDPAEERHGR